jgi:hypothetical protein
MGSAPTNGNLLVAFSFDTGGNPAAASGWTLLALGGSGALDAAILYKTAGAGESTSQTPQTGGSGNSSQIIWEVHGAAVPSSVAFSFYRAVGSADGGTGGPGGVVPSVPVVANKLALMALGGVTPGTAINSVYGANTVASLSGTGVQTGYGSSDSTNSQSFGLGADWAAQVGYGYCMVVVTA